MSPRRRELRERLVEASTLLAALVNAHVHPDLAVLASMPAEQAVAVAEARGRVESLQLEYVYSE